MTQALRRPSQKHFMHIIVSRAASSRQVRGVSIARVKTGTQCGIGGAMQHHV